MPQHPIPILTERALSRRSLFRATAVTATAATAAALVAGSVFAGTAAAGELPASSPNFDIAKPSYDLFRGKMLHESHHVMQGFAFERHGNHLYTLDGLDNVSRYADIFYKNALVG